MNIEMKFAGFFAMTVSVLHLTRDNRSVSHPVSSYTRPSNCYTWKETQHLTMPHDPL